MPDLFTIPISTLEFDRPDRRDPCTAEHLRSPDYSLDPPPQEREARDYTQDLDRLDRYLRLLDPEDQDIFTLRYRRHKTQQEIGEIFGGITQAAINYRLQRIQRQLQFLFRWPLCDKTADDLRVELRHVFTQRPHDLEMMAHWLDCRNSAETARRISRSQTVAYYGIIRCLKQLRVAATLNPPAYAQWSDGLDQMWNSRALLSVWRTLRGPRKGRRKRATADPLPDPPPPSCPEGSSV